MMNDADIIECVRAKPELYDKTHEGFKNPAIKEAAWMFISGFVAGPDGCSPTAEQVRNRWNNLRERYVKEKKVLDGKTRSGAAAYECRWPHFSAMSFLDIHIRSRQSRSNFLNTPSPSDSQSTSDSTSPFISDSESSQSSHLSLHFQPRITSTQLNSQTQTLIPLQSPTPHTNHTAGHTISIETIEAPPITTPIPLTTPTPLSTPTPVSTPVPFMSPPSPAPHPVTPHRTPTTSTSTPTPTPPGFSRRGSAACVPYLASKKPKKDDQAFQILSGTLNNISKELVAPEEVEDADYHLGKSITVALRSIKDQKERLRMRIKFRNILNECEEKALESD